MTEELFPKVTEQPDTLTIRYKRVSAMYKTVLDLTSKILYELENNGSERLIDALIEEKLRVADKINPETEDLNLNRNSPKQVVNSSTIREVKEILSDIQLMLAELFEREERITILLKKKRK